MLARTPDKVLPNGKSLPQISCFVVETAWPGVERVRRSRFMGLRGIANGVVTFKDVKVPAENLIGKPGEGLKIALATLNVGRLGIPAAAIGGGMALVDDAKWWTSTRQQWGQPVGKHQAVAKMISSYMAQLFAMKAMVQRRLRVRGPQERRHPPRGGGGEVLVFRDAVEDVRRLRAGARRTRLRAAPSRCTRAASARPRSRWALRDARINRIFEGSSQVMHLIMAREALDTHFKLVMPILQPKPGQKVTKGEAMMKAAGFYATWLPKLFMPDTGGHLDAPNLSEQQPQAPRLRGEDVEAARAAAVRDHGEVRPEAREGADHPRQLRRHRRGPVRDGLDAVVCRPPRRA